MWNASNNHIYKMSIYYNYAPYGSKLVVLSYIYGCLYWYTYEELVKWFMDTYGNRFHVSFLGYAHWFVYIRTSQLNYYSKFHKTKLPHDMVFTKEDASAIDEQVEAPSI